MYTCLIIPVFLFTFPNLSPNILWSFFTSQYPFCFVLISSSFCSSISFSSPLLPRSLRLGVNGILLTISSRAKKTDMITEATGSYLYDFELSCSACRMPPTLPSSFSSPSPASSLCCVLVGGGIWLFRHAMQGSPPHDTSHTKPQPRVFSQGISYTVTRELCVRGRREMGEGRRGRIQEGGGRRCRFLCVSLAVG